MTDKLDVKCFGLVGLCVLGLAFSFCSGCGSARGEIFPGLENPIVWPGAPEQGRIGYVGTISTEEDLKRGISWIEGLGEFIFGRDKVGVLIGPVAVVSCQDGRLVVADNAGLVHVFNLSSRDYLQFGAMSKGESLLSPVALTVVDNDIYVVDSKLQKVCVFGKDGRFRFSFGDGRLRRPTGIAYWGQGEKVFVSDTGRHVVEIFDRTGRLEKTIGSRGIEPGQFNFPTFLWVDKEGKLYVSDTLNYRIQIFTSNGKFLRTFGEHGDRPGYFAHPSGVAVDGYGHIYVVDKQFENVQVFDNNGDILMAWGNEGSGIGEFWLPTGLYIDQQNKIYVADSYNKRVQVFELLRVD
jgi:DNA-binding beta-propeller fold protein YncE